MIRYHFFRPLVLVLGLAVLMIAEPAPAKGKGPTNQRFQGYIYVPLPTPLPPPPYFGSFDIRPWTDKVSPLGFVSGYFTVDTAGNWHRTGRIFLQNKYGDSMTLTYWSQYDPDANDPNFYGQFTIVGGTGKFAGATGGGDIIHQLRVQAPYGGPEQFGGPYIPVWFDGRISY